MAKIAERDAIAQSEFLLDVRAAEEARVAHAYRLPASLVGHKREAELPKKDDAITILVSNPPTEVENEAVAFLRSRGYSVKAVLQVPEEHTIPAAEERPLWRPCPFLQRSVASLSPGTVLDVGCGSGRDSVFLAMQGWQVTSLDHLSKMCQRTQTLAERHKVAVRTVKAKSSPDATLAFSSREDLDHVKNTQFDLVVCVRFLQREILPMLAQMVKPGGRFLCQQFSDGCQHVGPCSPSDPQRILQEKELTRTFESFGFLVEQDEVVHLSDGRPVCNFRARKPLCDDDTAATRDTLSTASAWAPVLQRHRAFVLQLRRGKKHRVQRHLHKLNKRRKKKAAVDRVDTDQR
ncbi:MAG: hypothetical protein MHM6MM_001980 [Cercozoa sp. M6MM]